MPLAAPFILGEVFSGNFNREAHIRSFGVGLLAIAAVTAASLIFRRRRPLLARAGTAGRLPLVEDLYEAGL